MPKPLANFSAPILFAKFLIQLLSLCARIFTLRVTTAAFWLLGYLLSFFRPRELQMSVAQIEMVKRTAPELCTHPFFTKKTSTQASRLVFAHVAKIIGETLLIPVLLKDSQRFIEEQRDSLAEEIISTKQGAVCISGHLGCFEIIAASHIANGHVASSFGRFPNIAWVGAFVRYVRESNGVEMIWRNDKTSGRKLVRALRGSNYLAAIIDQDVALENKFCSFFGIDAAYPIAPIRMAIRENRPILVSLCVRLSPTKHRVIFRAISYDKDNPNAEDEVLHKFNEILQSLIAQYPDQWIWWHRRWRRRPKVDYKANPEKLRNSREYLAWVKDMGKDEK